MTTNSDRFGRELEATVLQMVELTKYKPTGKIENEKEYNYLENLHQILRTIAKLIDSYDQEIIDLIDEFDARSITGEDLS